MKYLIITLMLFSLNLHANNQNHEAINLEQLVYKINKQSSHKITIKKDIIEIIDLNELINSINKEGFYNASPVKRKQMEEAIRHFSGANSPELNNKQIYLFVAHDPQSIILKREWFIKPITEEEEKLELYINKKSKKWVEAQLNLINHMNFWMNYSEIERDRL